MKVRVSMNKATNLSELRMVCRYYPLDNDNLSSFYVDTTKARGIDMLEDLVLQFDYIPEAYQQILYMGHSGSGKSTLLFQLENRLNGMYDVIRFSVQELLDINNMDLVDLLYVMYQQLLEKYEDQLENENLLNNVFTNWYSIVSNETQTNLQAELGLDGQIGVGIKSKIINLFSTLNSSMRMGTIDKETVRTEVNKNITNYIKQFNQLVAECEKAAEKPILIMVEDLEKLTITDNAKSIFVSKGVYFHDINCRMLLTAPIYLKYTFDYNDTILQNFSGSVMCPMIAVTNMDRSKFELGINTIKKIVYARINDNLIDDSVLEKVIMYSGGILRDLFTMLRDASLQAELDNRNKILNDDIEFAFLRLQEIFECSLREKHLPFIKKIYNNPQGIISEANSDFMDLMRTRIIIEYNGKQWRGIHPAVIQYIQDHKWINLQEEQG